MYLRSIDSIDHRIARLQALMKRLRAERRLAVLREKHRRIKFGDKTPGSQDFAVCGENWTRSRRGQDQLKKRMNAEVTRAKCLNG